MKLSVKLIDKMSQGVQNKRGRPQKPFDQLSDSAKRKNAKKMRDNLSTEEIGYALEKFFKTSGFTGAAKVVKSLVENPRIGDDYLKSFENEELVKEYTADEAVALTMDVKFSKRQYDTVYFILKRKKETADFIHLIIRFWKQENGATHRVNLYVLMNSDLKLICKLF